MLRTGECKFSVSREARVLWEKLERENCTKDFPQKFWRTYQGTVVQNILRRRGMKVINVNMEKRPGDDFENLYIQVMPIKKEDR